MRAELSKLHDRLQTTMIYVTHDQVEAMTMGDEICVMKDGVIQQTAPPLKLYDYPQNRFVAGFIGSPPMNFINAKLMQKSGSEKERGIWLRETSVQGGSDGFQLKLIPETEDAARPYIGKTVILGVRPEDIYDRLFYAGGIHEGSWTKATVEVVEPMGAEKYLYLNTGRNTFVARVEPHNSAKPQQDIELVFNMDKIHLFDTETEKAVV
jgi:multiple sugar transport system ATP-binding protein